MEWLYGHTARRKSPKLVWSVIRCRVTCANAISCFLFLFSSSGGWCWEKKKKKHTSTYFRTRWAAKATELNRHTAGMKIRGSVVS